MKNQDLQKEVLLFLKRKRRNGRSLTDSELKKFLTMGSFEKEEKHVLGRSADHPRHVETLRFLLKGKVGLCIQNQQMKKMSEVKR